MSKAATGGGVSLSTALLVLFIALKLTGHITWSWFWVLAPAWMPVGLVLSCVLIIGAAAGVAGIYDAIDRRRHRKARKRIGLG